MLALAPSSILLVVLPSTAIPDLQDSRSILVVSPALLKLSMVQCLQARCLDPTLALEELSILAPVCITAPGYILVAADPWVAQPIDCSRCSSSCYHTPMRKLIPSTRYLFL